MLNNECQCPSLLNGHLNNCFGKKPNPSNYSKFNKTTWPSYSSKIDNIFLPNYYIAKLYLEAHLIDYSETSANFIFTHQDEKPEFELDILENHIVSFTFIPGYRFSEKFIFWFRKTAFEKGWEATFLIDSVRLPKIYHAGVVLKTIKNLQHF